MVELKVQNRTRFGKQVKRLRKEGFIPAEVYGRQFPNLHLAIPVKAFAGVYREAGAHTVITLVTEEGEKIPSLIVAVAQDPLTRTFLAVDFHHIRTDERVKAKIPITFAGEAPAVKAGHLVVTVHTELEVEALPHELPHRFSVDIGGLADVGQSIHVSDLAVPAGAKILAPHDTVIVTVSERRKEEIAAPAAAAPAEAAAPGETPEGAATPTAPTPPPSPR